MSLQITTPLAETAKHIKSKFGPVLYIKSQKKAPALKEEKKESSRGFI
jgi:hypothetical protein